VHSGVKRTKVVFSAMTIAIHGLTYSHDTSDQPSLSDISLQLPSGSRTIIVGANGGMCSSAFSRESADSYHIAGKSTLLQILAGKRLIKDADVRINGKDVFRNSPAGIAYLGTEWSVASQLTCHILTFTPLSIRATNPVVRGDIVVSVFLDSVGGYRHKGRRDKLLDILDIDLDWHMHAISDGERRRVQLCMGLMAPWDVLLLDEVSSLPFQIPKAYSVQPRGYG